MKTPSSELRSNHRSLMHSNSDSIDYSSSGETFDFCPAGLTVCSGPLLKANWSIRGLIEKLSGVKRGANIAWQWSYVNTLQWTHTGAGRVAGLKKEKRAAQEPWNARVKQVLVLFRSSIGVYEAKQKLPNGRADNEMMCEREDGPKLKFN